ncbi:hypothetical protein L2E82_40257 [Cichorium intybus]|uniref:Uncharacterized protein n=1 Tax=Cichorium intybus TaxID=13427 RepID=A0ACB9AJR3_CICIN|nr:hypothetical protein L2E82_40257 [Cichorium intybus]
MSVVGFDIGNENCAIAVAKRGGIDVILNDESKRETHAVVSFGEKQRFLGSAGAAFATTNPKSTISQIKRLIGRQYKEPSVQEDLKLLPFETSEGPHGGILIHIQYLKKRWTFPPVEILGMLFAHLKQMTEKNLDSPVVDCVIGIPSYFTDLQRREYLNAAFIAGLRPLKLIHDGTAVALGYGMYTTDFSNNGPTNVIFVDIGHCATQVTVAAFEQGRMTILLRASCEKLKKVLSANAEAPLSIESLIDDKDVVGFITREEFENLSVELLERVTNVCRKAGKDSGLSADKIHTIELVGSGSRIPAIMRKLTLLFDKEPMRTLNGSECVARGCALNCAMLSPTLFVRDYKVKDIFPYSVGLYFDDGENRKHSKLTPFPKGSPFPSNKTVPYHGNIVFCCEVFYTDNMDFPSGISPTVGHFKIGPYQTSGAENVKATVNVQLNDHGIVEIESASFLEIVQPSRDTSLFYSLVMMVANGLTKNDAVDYKPAGSSRLPTRRAVEARRNPARRQKLTVSENYDVLTTIDEVHEAQTRALMFAEQDIKVEQTKEKRNTLESFIYDTRSKLLSSYRSVATDSEEEIISKRLQETEDWLYGEGDDESELVYIRNFEDLKKLFDPIANIYKEENVRKEATKALQTCIQENRLAADLLPSCQKNEVVNNECIQAEVWLDHLSQLQDSFAKNATRIYCSSAVSGITEALKRYLRRCKVIVMSKPSLPKYNEPVDSDRKQNPDDMLVDN